MKKIYLLLVVLLAVLPAKAQILFSEDFDSYPVGAMNQGQGGWTFYPSSTVTPAISIPEIIAEPNKGNVLNIYDDNQTDNNGGQVHLSNLTPQIWDNRDVGNDILLVEYDVYIPSLGAINYTELKLAQAYLIFEVRNNNNNQMKIHTGPTSSNYKDNVYFLANGSKSPPGSPKFYNNFLFNTWISVQIYVDYNSEYVYFYIPSLNINNKYKPSGQFYPFYGNLNIETHTFNDSSQGIKYDNIKVSAIDTLPSYILSTNEFITEKFNVFPNPATNVVTITNNENIVVTQIAVYDTTGKLISTQNFNEQAEIQLNVENLASGT